MVISQHHLQCNAQMGVKREEKKEEEEKSEKLCPSLLVRLFILFSLLPLLFFIFFRNAQGTKEQVSQSAAASGVHTTIHDQEFKHSRDRFLRIVNRRFNFRSPTGRIGIISATLDTPVTLPAG